MDGENKNYSDRCNFLHQSIRIEMEGQGKVTSMLTASKSKVTGNPYVYRGGYALGGLGPTPLQSVVMRA